MRDPEETRSIGYQVMRYMEHLNDVAFEQRVCDILLNLQLGTPPRVLVNPLPMGWEFLWRDAIDEAYRRFGESVAKQFLERVQTRCIAARQPYPRLSSDDVADFIKRAGVNDEPFLVRYSKRERLEALVVHGRLRIFPATRYDDPSLNPAIRDDELKLAIQPHGLKAEVLDKTGRPKGSIKVIDNLLTSVSPRNYYVHCLSGFLSPDLFPDFNADACVVIRNRALYARRILDGLHSRLPYPEWSGGLFEVKYVDPLNARVRQFHVPLAKHFRYAYQREWRIIWVPDQDIRDLPYIDLELGSMADCCTLLVP